MQNKLPRLKRYLGIKTRLTFMWSGLFVIFLCATSFLFAGDNRVEEARKIAEGGDYKKAYEKLLVATEEIQAELENERGLVEYYKKEVSDLKGDTPKVVDYKYNEAANRMWASAWRMQHDGVFKKMGQEKRETLEKAASMFKRIVIDYPYADKAEDAQFRVGRIYYKFIKDNESAETELERYLTMYPKGKYASDAKSMLRRIKGK